MEATRALETVIVIEDDESMRSALARLIRSVGLRVQTFSSAQEFLGSPLPEGPSCMVLDMGIIYEGHPNLLTTGIWFLGR